MKIKLMFLVFIAATVMNVTATPIVQNITAKQRFPWNGLVDVKFDVVGDVTEGTYDWNVELVVVATNQVTGEAWIANNLIGETGTAEGTHNIMWDMKAQGLNIKSDDIQFIVTYRRKWNIDKSMKYCVIDLSGGSNATKFPVSYLADVPQGGWSTEHKTSKLVLRLIEPGSFMMQGRYAVTLSKPYYMGVFEVTQKQYQLINGGNPSYHNGDMLPVEQVSWNDIRGDSDIHNWPNVKTKGSLSLVGLLSSKTGLNFDLPTEAQWEYACRAGTTTIYYWGDSMNSLYAHNDRAIHKVGEKKENAWGLFDMSGNVYEWCLDWHGQILNGIDPEGALSATYRVRRGGSWAYDESYCTSGFRNCSPPSKITTSFGFRLALHISK